MLRREVLPPGETVTDEAGDWPSPLPDSWVVFLGGEKTVFTAEIDVEEENAMDKTMKTPSDIECPRCKRGAGEPCSENLHGHHRERIDAAFRIAWDEMKVAIEKLGKMARGEE